MPLRSRLLPRPQLDTAAGLEFPNIRTLRQLRSADVQHKVGVHPKSSDWRDPARDRPHRVHSQYLGDRPIAKLRRFDRTRSSVGTPPSRSDMAPVSGHRQATWRPPHYGSFPPLDALQAVVRKTAFHHSPNASPRKAATIELEKIGGADDRSLAECDGSMQDCFRRMAISGTRCDMVVPATTDRVVEQDALEAMIGDDRPMAVASECGKDVAGEMQPAGFKSSAR